MEALRMVGTKNNLTLWFRCSRDVLILDSEKCRDPLHPFVRTQCAVFHAIPPLLVVWI
jgi:hypothetical protein